MKDHTLNTSIHFIHLIEPSLYLCKLEIIYKHSPAVICKSLVHITDHEDL
jgi:hypothetical protein